VRSSIARAAAAGQPRPPGCSAKDSGALRDPGQSTASVTPDRTSSSTSTCACAVDGFTGTRPASRPGCPAHPPPSRRAARRDTEGASTSLPRRTPEPITTRSAPSNRPRPGKWATPPASPSGVDTAVLHPGLPGGHLTGGEGGLAHVQLPAQHAVHVRPGGCQHQRGGHPDVPAPLAGDQHTVGRLVLQRHLVAAHRTPPCRPGRGRSRRPGWRSRRGPSPAMAARTGSASRSGRSRRGNESQCVVHPCIVAHPPRARVGAVSAGGRERQRPKVSGSGPVR